MSVRAAELEASNDESNDGAVSLSGSTGLLGKTNGVYVFRGLDSATGTVNESAKLSASDSVVYLGSSVSVSGTVGLVGDEGSQYTAGAAYVFRNLDTITGTVIQNAKLVASDGTAENKFGSSVSLSGTMGLVGAFGDNDWKGAAYVFRGLDNATGTILQGVKLIPSDLETSSEFGARVSLAGSNAVIGSGNNAAYVFRNLDSVTGTVVENARLTASSGQLNGDVSLSGSSALVGATGGALLFRNLDTITGTVTENVKLTTSFEDPDNQFGSSFVSLSGSNALVGGLLFQNLDSAVGTVTEDVVLGSSSLGSGMALGSDGDLFILGTITCNVSSVTTLNAGNISRIISGISFSSRKDWIIGKTTDNNSITFVAGANSADVVSDGKAIYIGKEAGSDANSLILSKTPYFVGVLQANYIYVGSLAGNHDNFLQIEDFTAMESTVLRMAPGNFLSLKGDYTDYGYLFMQLAAQDISIEVFVDSDWKTINEDNYWNYIAISYDPDSDHTSIEPGTSPAPVPAITSAGTVSGKVGVQFTYEIAATNIPTSYSATGVPAGLKLVSLATAGITGTPTTPGTFNVTVKATNVAGTGTKTIKITIAKETIKPVVSVTTPSSLKATTTASSYTVKAKATDNISPVTMQYRVDPPGTAGYGAYKSISLPGTATSKSWSCKLLLSKKGVWKMQIRALDASGNISAVKTVTITRK